MIRIVTIGSLITLLILVLYLPSAHPPERFLAQLRHEHAGNQAFWGDDVSQQILDRMVVLQEGIQRHSPVPAAASAPSDQLMAPAVAQEMARVNARLFNNSYFRSIDALLVLACYRLATLLCWIAPSWVIALALCLDAQLERVRKAKEFRQHDPEMFAVFASAAIITVCACDLALVWPWTLPPIAWALMPLAVALSLARAVSHFHRRPS